MLIKKLIAFMLPVSLFFAGCRKDDTPSNSNQSTPTEDCFEGNAVGSGDIVEGQYIVSYRANTAAGRGMTPARLRDIAAQTLNRHSIQKAALRASFAGEPGGFVAVLSAQEAAALKTDADVEIVEPDRIISLGSCFTVAAPRLITWNIARVGYGNGIGKRAWIVDTGIDFDHPDLTVDAGLSKSFIPDQTSARDENGHGTHVAGVIGAKNNTIGVLGVASGATLVSLRVLDKDGKGLLSSMVQALAYVNNNASPGDVVNMSVGDDEGISATLDQQVKNTASKGIFIAIAAGNEKAQANQYSPGRNNAENIYTVSAVDSLDNFASFSNYGNDVVDFAAPGVRILSTYLNGKYAYMSGTSMAAPHVAGLLLLRGKGITSSGNAKKDPDPVADPIAHY